VVRVFRGSSNTPQTPPVLLAEENSDLAIALTSVATLRDPFPLIDAFNLSSDRQARIMLFATNLHFFPGDNSSSVTAAAESAQGVIYLLPVESAGKMPSFDWLSEIVVKLPANLPSNQDVRVSVTFHGQTSNKVRVKIK
jgi:hypothetical protein